MGSMDSLDSTNVLKQLCMYPFIILLVLSLLHSLRCPSSPTYHM